MEISCGVEQPHDVILGDEVIDSFDALDVVGVNGVVDDNWFLTTCSNANVDEINDAEAVEDHVKIEEPMVFLIT